MLLSLMTGAVVIFCNLVSQMINERIDPRIKIPREVHLDD